MTDFVEMFRHWNLISRRLLGAAMGLHPDAELACAAIKMAVAARGYYGW